MIKAYTVNDLFYTSWKQLDSKYAAHAEAYALYLSLQVLQKGSTEYGVALIKILASLRKRKRLVERIDEQQAVDIFNELERVLLVQPWYNFPKLGWWSMPDEKLARTTFDQFIYADNEYTGILVAQRKGAATTDLLKGMARLAVTLYTTNFDKERVEADANELGIKKVVQLQLIFFTFGHVREFVVKRCKHLLPPAPAGEQDEPPPLRTSGEMWYEIKHQAARTLVFGDFDKLGKTNMYSVLDHLNKLARDAKP